MSYSLLSTGSHIVMVYTLLQSVEVCCDVANVGGGALQMLDRSLVARAADYEHMKKCIAIRVRQFFIVRSRNSAVCVKIKFLHSKQEICIYVSVPSHLQ